MHKVAFLFPGQGSQSAGMGRSLAQSCPEARQVFEEADDALGFAISRLCFEGPDSDLKLTENTQPALLTVAVAAHRVLAKAGVSANYVAGHSLGEYSALVTAGALQFRDAVRLVRERGRYMQDAVPPGVGGMAALLKLPPGKLDEVLLEAAQGEVVTAANVNSADQIVIAGHTGAIARAIELAKAAGARKAVVLHVSAPFHCPLMKPAQDQMRPKLESTAFADLTVPLVNNWQAREIRTGEEARAGLIEQIPSPVLWMQTVEYLRRQGVTEWIEAGPGSVLTNLLRSFDRSMNAWKFGEVADLEKIHALV